MKTVYHKADTRGDANHGWLHSKHSFSFANYYNPERMNFGVLRVLNDDIVSGGMGFGTHPHKDMEIISIPLSGDLEHKDSMGNTTVIKEGDVQVMSAGTGVQHSEKNKNEGEEVRFLQIWIVPNKTSVIPRYDQITLDSKNLDNTLFQILSPDKNDDGVWVHQDAWMHMGNLKKDNSTTYDVKKSENSVYVFVLDGKIKIGEQFLDKRDALGIWETDSITIDVVETSKVLLIDVPMI